MADLTITASQVQPGSGTPRETATAGATITAGQVLYKDSTDSNKMKLADANGTQAVATALGVALHGASSGQPVTYQKSGAITIGAGASMTVGEIYVLSETAGSIAPEADISASNSYVVTLGVATSASVLDLNIRVSGAQIP